MRTSMSTPILALSGARGSWEADAGVTELLEVARTADRLGFDYMTCSGHVGVPREDAVELPAGFDILHGAAQPLDPIGAPDAVLEARVASAQAGATVFRLTVRHESAGHFLDQLAAYAEIVAAS